MCFGAGVGKPLFLSETDQSSGLVACYPADAVGVTLRDAYYAIKIFKTILPPP